MGIRKTLNEYPAIAVVAVLVVIVALAFVIRAQTQPLPPPPAMQVFYSDDGGKTFFSDDITKFPPFDRGGNEAVQAFLFTCDGGQTRFVGYLMKYAPAGRQRLVDAHGRQGGDYTDGLEHMPPREVLYRSPTSSEWFQSGDARAEAIRRVPCPGGGLASAVLPNR